MAPSAPGGQPEYRTALTASALFKFFVATSVDLGAAPCTPAGIEPTAASLPRRGRGAAAAALLLTGRGLDPHAGSARAAASAAHRRRRGLGGRDVDLGAQAAELGRAGCMVGRGACMVGRGACGGAAVRMVVLLGNVKSSGGDERRAAQDTGVEIAVRRLQVAAARTHARKPIEVRDLYNVAALFEDAAHMRNVCAAAHAHSGAPRERISEKRQYQTRGGCGRQAAWRRRGAGY